MIDIHQSTRDHIIQTGLALCRSSGDYQQLLRTARSFRYWSLRLELNDPGPIDEELARIAEPDVVALRCAIRQDRRVLREPLGDWHLKGAALLERIGSVPALADMAAEGADLLAGEPGVGSPPLHLTDRWSERQRSPRVRSRRLDGHDRPVTGCTMLSHQPWLVTADGSEVLIWDMEREILRAVLDGGDGSEIFDACSSESGEWLATVQVPGGQTGAMVGNKATLRVWNLRDGGPPRVLSGEKDGVYACEESPDGRWLVAHHSERRAAFWDTTDWKLAGVISGPPDRDFRGDKAATCYAPDGSWFALANGDGTIGLWDPATRRQLHLLPGSREQAVTLRAPWDSSWLASLDKSGIRIWDTRRGTLIRAVATPADGFGGVIADPRGRWVAASFGPDSVRVIPVRQDGQHSYVRRAADLITRRLPAARAPGAWDFGGAFCRAYQDGDRIASVTAFETTSHGRNQIHSRYVFSSWDPRSGSRLSGPTSRPGGLPQLIVHENGQWAAAVSVGSESQVEFFDPATAVVTSEFGYGRDRIRSIATSSRWVAAGFESGAVRLFQPASAAPVTETPVRRALAGLDGCYAPPDGRFVLAWSWSGRKVVVLDPRSGAVRSQLAGQETGVFVNDIRNSCCFAPDGSWVATLDDDGTLRVWHPETAQQLARVPAQGGERFLPGSCASSDWMVTLDGGRLRVRDRRAFLLGELPSQRTGRVSRAIPAGPEGLAAEDEAGIQAWDLRSGRHLYDLADEHGAAALASSRAHPEGLLVTLGPQGDVRFRAPANGRLLGTSDTGFPNSRSDGYRIRVVDPAGNWVVMSDARGGLTVLVVASGEVRNLSGRSGDQVTACTASPDGSMLATTRQSGVLVVWDALAWEQLATADTERALTDACWAPAGDCLYAVGGSDAACFDTTALGSSPR